jgi:hypothetical protein
MKNQNQKKKKFIWSTSITKHTKKKELVVCNKTHKWKGKKLSWSEAYAANTQQKSLSYVTKHTKEYEEAYLVCDGSR